MWLKIVLFQLSYLSLRPSRFIEPNWAPAQGGWMIEPLQTSLKSFGSKASLKQPRAYYSHGLHTLAFHALGQAFVSLRLGPG